MDEKGVVAKLFEEFVADFRDAASSHAVVHPGGHDHPSLVGTPCVEARIAFRLNHAVLLELRIEVSIPHVWRLLEAVQSLVAEVVVAMFVDDIDDVIDIRE